MQLKNLDISDKELKQRWRIYWLQSIFEFSNTKFQEISWNENSQTEQFKEEFWTSSPQACLSAYFDDLALYDEYTKAVESNNVSKEEVNVARSFHILAYLYDEPSQNPQDVLKDVEWLEIVTLAQKFWQYLKVNVTSKREIDLMQKLEKEFS